MARCGVEGCDVMHTDRIGTLRLSHPRENVPLEKPMFEEIQVLEQREREIDHEIDGYRREIYELEQARNKAMERRKPIELQASRILNAIAALRDGQR